MDEFKSDCDDDYNRVTLLGEAIRSAEIIVVDHFRINPDKPSVFKAITASGFEISFNSIKYITHADSIPT